MTARLRRWLALALALIAATAAILFSPAAPASAAPATVDPAEASLRRAAVAAAPGQAASQRRAPSNPDEADDGAENPLLQDVLESTGRRYAQARAAYKKSRASQLKLSLAVGTAEARRDELLPQAGQVAAASYRTGSLSSLGFLLNSRSSDAFLQRAMSLNEMNALNDSRLRALNDAVNDVAVRKAALDQEIRSEQKLLAAMDREKVQAEKALSLVGGENLTKGFVVATSPKAAPAPRNADGGFSSESCSVPDPTTGGCITPRTFHMFKEVKKAGFDRFVGCHRNGGPFEHPKGRACDWSLQRRGFSVAHTADKKKYGNDLMAFLVRNADRLGILYVIWFKQIWFPATGWKSYHGPSAHTDHVHVSML